jgi:hypothetical protein
VKANVAALEDATELGESVKVPEPSTEAVSEYAADATNVVSAEVETEIV